VAGNRCPTGFGVGIGGKEDMNATHTTPHWRAPQLVQRLLTAAGLWIGMATPVFAAAVATPPRSATSPAALTRETTFGEAIEVLRNATAPPLNIVVLWRPIADHADIHRDTPIGFDSVPGLRLRQYLEILLLSVSAGGVAPLEYVVDGGAIIVATADALPARRRVARVYDVSDLVATPSYAPAPGMMRMMMGGGMMGGYGQGFGAGYGGPMGGPGQGLGGGYGGSNSAGGLPGLVGSVQGRTRSRTR